MVHFLSGLLGCSFWSGELSELIAGQVKSHLAEVDEVDVPSDAATSTARILDENYATLLSLAWAAGHG